MQDVCRFWITRDRLCLAPPAWATGQGLTFCQLHGDHVRAGMSELVAKTLRLRALPTR